jgi:hypothetical protein
MGPPHFDCPEPPTSLNPVLSTIHVHNNNLKRIKNSLISQANTRLSFLEMFKHLNNTLQGSLNGFIWMLGVPIEGAAGFSKYENIPDFNQS